MSNSFDPYKKWLGISPKDQPPDHYRLLGVERFEDDPDVIETAADQRAMLLRTFQTGEHAAHSQRLLNEVTQAKLCLLNAKKRAAYDAGLREAALEDEPVSSPTSSALEALAESAALDTIPLATATVAPTAPSALPVARRLPKKRPQRRNQNLVRVLVGAAVGTVLLLAGFITLNILTDEGQVVIEYSDPSIEAVVRQGDEVVKKIRLTQQQNRITIATGKYEVELRGVGADQLKLETNRFVLTRGEEEIVKITRTVAERPPVEPPPPVRPTPPKPEPPQPEPPKPEPPEPEPPKPDTPKPEPPKPPDPMPKPPPREVRPAEFALRLPGKGLLVVSGTAKETALDREFTAEVWVRWDQPINGQHLMGNQAFWSSRAEDSLGAWNLWNCRVEKAQFGQISLQYRRSDERRLQMGPRPKIPKDGAWHHIAFCRSKDRYWIFCDGKAIANEELILDDRSGERRGDFYVGAPGSFHAASIDVAAVRLSRGVKYREDFTPLETLPKDEQTIAVLDFSREQDEQIDDLSGNERHATIKDASWVPIE